MNPLFPVDPDSVPDLFEEDLGPDPVSESQSRSGRSGKEFDVMAFEFIEKAGARILERYIKVSGYAMDALIEGTNGNRFYVDAHGTPDQTDRPQAGMRRQDTMLKFGFKALRLRDHKVELPLLLITSHLPGPTLDAAFLLHECSDAVFDAVSIFGDMRGFHRLRHYFTAVPAPTVWLPAPWRERPIQMSFDDLGVLSHDESSDA